MNKKQWFFLILGVISIFVYIATVVNMKPYRTSNAFWLSHNYGMDYTMKLVPFLGVLLLIIGVFYLIIWVLRTKAERTSKISNKKSPFERDFVERLKKLGELKERGTITEEEFKQGKRKILEEK